MRGREGLRFGQWQVFPNRVRKRVVLSFTAFEKVKLYKSWHLVEMTVT
jgi:hypothetical protein